MSKTYDGHGHKIVEAAAWVLMAIMLTVIFKTLAFMLIPLCISLLLCYALGIPMDFLKKIKVPKHLRILLLVLGVLSIIYLLGRLISTNIREFQVMMPVFEEKFWNYAGNLLSWLNISPEQAREGYEGFLGSFKGTDLESLGTVLKRLSSSFFSFMGSLIWVLLFMIFILAERESFHSRLIMIFGDDSGQVLEVIERINRAVQHYLGLKALISLVTGALVSVALYLFGVPFALLWGVLAFLLNFIPNIGSLIAVIPPVAITLFQYGSLGRTLGVACVLTAIQVIIGSLLEPRLMGKSLHLSPLVVLLALLFWGWMWGLPGMLLSVPMTAGIKIALEQMDRTRSIAILMGGK